MMLPTTATLSYIGYSIRQSCWTAYGVFIALCFISVLLHESFHYLAGKACRLPGGRLIVSPVKGSGSRFPLPAIEFEPEYLLAIPRYARQLIFAAGTVGDYLFIVGMWALITFMPMAPAFREGIGWAVALRVLGIAANVIPNGKFKNDGWRIMHPDSDE